MLLIAFLKAKEKCPSEDSMLGKAQATLAPPHHKQQYTYLQEKNPPSMEPQSYHLGLKSSNIRKIRKSTEPRKAVKLG